APEAPEPGVGVGVWALLGNDGPGALAAGARVLEHPAGLPVLERGEARLLVGAGSYATGRLARAESSFAAALGDLSGPIRDHLTDITPAASDEDTAAWSRLPDSGARARFLERFWKERDPDLTTPENELRLEFLSRAATAYFLYYDPRSRGWDERGWLVVRYGLPGSTEYNPPRLQ